LDLLGGVTRIKAVFDQVPGRPPNEFQQATVDAIARISGVNLVSKVNFKWKKARTTMSESPLEFDLQGVEATFWDINNFYAKSGRLIDQQDVDSRATVCVLGEDLAKKIFGTTDVVGKIVEIDQAIFQVIGILGGSGVSYRTEVAFLPLTTAADRLRFVTLPNHLYVRVGDWNDVERVSKTIAEVVKQHQQDYGLDVLVAWEALKRVQSVAFIIEAFVLVVVIASFIMGGFGIWSAMNAAVRTRTREIGLKKAVGAEDGDILSEFLTEALTLSLLGGIVGVVLGRLSVEAASYYLGIRPLESVFFLMLALSLSLALVIGVAAGLYPSIKASRMDVVNALRYE
jgi:putative ABC transport system permease protein